MLYKWYSPLSVQIFSACCWSAATNFKKVCFVFRIWYSKEPVLQMKEHRLWQKKISAMMLVFGFIWKTLFCFSFFYLIFHQKSPLQKRFFSSNQCQAFTSYKTYSEVCKLQKKKDVAYIFPLNTTCDTISLYVDSFFTMYHTMFIYVHLVLRKSIRINIYISKVNIK